MSYPNWPNRIEILLARFLSVPFHEPWLAPALANIFTIIELKGLGRILGIY